MPIFSIKSPTRPRRTEPARRVAGSRPGDSRFDRRGLPQFEEDTRESIQGDKEHLLLFGTSGSAFVRAILVTQIEAGTYGMNLAKVLADAEPDTHRAAVVRKIGNRWEKLRDRAYALLNAT